jgi:hypothetical protein
MNKPGQHNESDSLEVFFSKNLGDAAMEPSARLWERIEHTLEQDRKEKRKKRFIWFFFAGLALLTGLSVSGFFLFRNTLTGQPDQPAAKTITANEHTTTSIKENHATDPDTLQKQSAETTEKINSATAEPAAASGKIQLGAFRRKLKPDYFDKVPAEVQQETGSDGVTRYYFQSADTLKDLSMVKEAGFKDAFVQKDGQAPVLLASTDVARKARLGKKNGGTINASKTEPAIAFNDPKNTQEPRATQPTVTATSDPPVAVVSTPVQKNREADPAKKQPVATAPSGNYPVVTAVAIDPPDTKEPLALSPVRDTGQVQSPPLLVASDTAKNPPPKDTLAKVFKQDTTQMAAKKPEKDSSFTPPFSRWAISIIGGPLFSFNQAHEKLPLTYTGDVRAEYFPIRNLSVTAGVSYQENKIEQEQTRFRFSKYISGDYQVQSSFGSMAIPKDLLLQGLFVQAPIDTFAANYKYDAKVQGISIPVQASWYFLNKRILQLSVSGGLYTSYVLLQSSHLSLIKEHRQDELYYKDVKTNRLNLLLMFSLGCDVRIAKRFYFTVAPSYKYGITNYSNTPGYVFKPSAFSATGGLKLKW